MVGVLVGLAGWGTLALLERRTPARARSGWTILALAVLAVSLAGPLTSATTTAATVALLGMHLTVAGSSSPAWPGHSHDPDYDPAISHPSAGRVTWVERTLVRDGVRLVCHDHGGRGRRH